MKKTQEKINGFSLVETLTYISIFTIAMIIIGQFFTNSFKDLSLEKSSSENSFKAQKFISTIVKELQDAKNADNGNYAVEKADANELIFYSDIDNDNRVERVRYYIENNIIKKGIIDPTGAPATYNLGSEAVTNFITNISNGTNSLFTYFDSNNSNQGNQLSTPAAPKNISLVKVYLKIANSMQANDKSPIEYQTNINLRNF